MRVRPARDPALCDRDLSRYRRRHPQLFPNFETIPDLTQGDVRFAAEVALAIIAPQPEGEPVPTFAHERALDTLHVLARG